MCTRTLTPTHDTNKWTFKAPLNLYFRAITSLVRCTEGILWSVHFFTSGHSFEEKAEWGRENQQKRSWKDKSCCVWITVKERRKRQRGQAWWGGSSLPGVHASCRCWEHIRPTERQRHTQEGADLRYTTQTPEGEKPQHNIKLTGWAGGTKFK